MISQFNPTSISFLIRNPPKRPLPSLRFRDSGLENQADDSAGGGTAKNPGRREGVTPNPIRLDRPPAAFFISFSRVPSPLFLQISY